MPIGWLNLRLGNSRKSKVSQVVVRPEDAQDSAQRPYSPPTTPSPARLCETFGNCQSTASSMEDRHHVVQNGDWLYDIGRRHNVDIMDILKVNPDLKDPDRLPIGSSIRIPRGSNSFPNELLSTRVVEAEKPSNEVVARIPRSIVTVSKHCDRPQKELGWKRVALNMLLDAFRKNREHTVRPGDSLECVAMRFGTTAAALRKLNNLGNGNEMLQPGSVLKIDKPKPPQPQRKKEAVKKATIRERTAMMEGTAVDLPQPVKAPMSENPAYKGPSLKRGAAPKPSRLKTVTVQYGDTLADIAWDHGLSVRELQRLNHLRDDNIFEGDVLTVSEAASQSEMDLQDLRSGIRRTSRLLFSRTPQPVATGLGIGGPELTPRAAAKSRVRTDGVKVGLDGRWKKRRRGFRHKHDKWLRFNSPVTDGFVSSGFGWRWGAFHEGVDLAADHGAPILASDKGVVTFAGWSGGYGYLVAIQHEGGFTTRYGHCCAIHARVGQQVMRGQQVAAVGATGHATGPHLHFEVRKNGEALDPSKWVNL